MRYHKYVPVAAGLAVVGLMLPSAVMAVDVPAVSGESTPLAIGDSRKTSRLVDGEEIWVLGLRVDENKIDVTRGNGCKTSRQVEDIYGPNLTWEDCNPGPWGTGKIENVSKKGQLWPLAVGNKVEYKFHAVNSKGKKNKKAFRKCEVTGTEMVTAGGKDYATYRTECQEHNGTRVFNYAPEVSTTVFAERNHKKRGRTTMEYLKDM